MDTIQTNFDRLAKDFRFSLNACQAILKVGAMENDTENVISALMAAAEVAKLCEFIIENTDVLSPGNRDRFEDFHKESQECLRLFKSKYKIALLATTPEKHTIEVPTHGNGRVIRHVEASAKFKSAAKQAKANKKHVHLSDAQWAEVDTWLTDLDFKGEPMAVVLGEIAEFYGVSPSTIEKRYYGLRK